MKYPHIRQHDEKDCGAACLSMICEYYGLKLPLSRFRVLIKEDNYGSNIYSLVTGAEQIGLHAEALEGTPDELMDSIRKKDVLFPFIARIVNKEMFEHYVVVYDIANNQVSLGDPAKEQIIRVSWDLFISQWQQQIITFSKNKYFHKANERKGSFRKYFKWILNQKKLLIVAFAVSLIISAISLISASVFQLIIDDAIIASDVNGANNKRLEHDGAGRFIVLKEKLVLVFNNLETVCLSVILLYLIQSGLQVWRGRMIAVMAKNVDIPLTLGYYEHLLDLPTAFFDTRKTGDLLSRFSDASKIRDAISTAALTVLLNTMIAVVTGFYLFYLNNKLFMITVAIIAIYAVITLCFHKPIKHINQELMEGASLINSHLKESIDGIETVKAYQYEPVSKQKTKKLFERVVNRVVHARVVYNLQEVLVGLTQSVGIVVLLWIGVYLCNENIVTVGMLVTFYYLLNYFLEPIKSLISLQPTIQTAIVAAERLNDIMDVPVEDISKNDINSLAGDITFEHISFRYGNRNLVLKNVDITIPGGKRVAIVGQSGSGKTTLVKLLMNFYLPESGVVSVNGRELLNYSQSSIRKHIAYISQDIFLFSDTIYNNLRMGDSSIKNEEIEKVCCLCLADSFIQELPFKYNSVLDENGHNLSGGQKQRLAIARALLRKPDILIMDEATSNLDTLTEESIQNVINEISDHMTVIIIAHRLRTIRNCDLIYVMESGEIKEVGRHDELLQRGGIYAKYWSSQA